MKNILYYLLLLSMFAFAWADETTSTTHKTETPDLKLKEGDVIALCGDSITQFGFYPRFLAIYQYACAGPNNITWKNFGRSGETARVFPPIMDKDVLPIKPTLATICYGMNNSRSSKVMSDKEAEKWGTGEITTVIKKFQEAGINRIFLASPGCVDSENFATSQNGEANIAAAKATNENLRKLRDNAEVIAKKEGLIFVDMHTPMMEVMAKAKEKYGKDFAFAGEKGDGVHPNQAGHIVMAWAYLKAMGYSGQIGTITLDFKKNTAQATEGHSIVSCENGTITLESTRYPFCFSGDSTNPNAKTTRSVIDLFPFNEDLNRYLLIVKEAPAKTKITWGNQSKEFDAAHLEQGINLASEFETNPFYPAFNKIFDALLERNRCLGWLAKKEDPSLRKRLEKALKNMEIVPIKHEIKIEAVQ